MKDVVVFLVFLVGAQHRRVGFQCLEGIHHDGKRIVLDLHSLDAVSGAVAVGRDHSRHLLRLIHDFVGGEHHLRVRHQRRHPV
jgi:hypothetical protein